MLLSILKWSRGYLTILLCGQSLERFMNLCRNRGILLWDMHTEGRCCVCNISVEGFRQLPPIVRKTSVRPHIRARYGLPFLVHRYWGRTGFLVGMGLCLFFIYYSSLFVWKITATGQYSHTEEELIKFLKTQGITPGTKIEQIDAAAAEEEVRKEFEDIGWVSIEITGTRLYIHISETNMPVGNENADRKESDLTAGHDGTIYSIITRRGTPMVEQGQEVKKGDVLVSGQVDVIGDDGVAVSTKMIPADADILLKTSYEYHDEFPLAFEKPEYTGQIKKSYGISLFGHTFFIENPLKRIDKFEKYDIIVSETDTHLGKDFILPCSFLVKTWREYRPIEQVYTKEEAKQEALEHLNRYLEALKEQDVEILKPKLTFSVSENMAMVSGEISVLEKQLPK